MPDATFVAISMSPSRTNSSLLRNSQAELEKTPARFITVYCMPFTLSGFLILVCIALFMATGAAYSSRAM
jgi:hypothetical protein